MNNPANPNLLQRILAWLSGRDRDHTDLLRNSEQRLADQVERLQQLAEQGERLNEQLARLNPNRVSEALPEQLPDNLLQLERAANELETALQTLTETVGGDWTRPPPPLPLPARAGSRFWYWLGRTVLLLIVVFVGYFGWLFASLPNVSQLEKLTNNLQIVVNKNDDKIAFQELIFNLQVSFEDMPQHLIDALLTREDRRFYEHPGVDFRGLARAVVQHLTGTGRGGGSTLTQQLAKNILLSSERSLNRKLKEAALAIKLEWTFDKNKILEMYLNRVHFGLGTNGIETAARKYFTKRAKDLNLREAAILVGSIPSPYYRNYQRNRETALLYAQSVLRDMEERELLPVPIERVPPVQPGGRMLRKIDHIAILDALREDIRGQAAGHNGLLTVITSIDTELQVYAELAARRKMINEGYRHNANEAAVVVLAPDGGVLAMVASVDRRRSTLNHVFDTRRQYGSVFKPIVYLTALENGWQAEDTISGASLAGSEYAPRNYNNRYPQTLTLRAALNGSVNTAVVRLQESVGREAVIKTAKRLGLDAELPNIPGLALGVAEGTLADMAGVYATLANGGHQVEPYLLVGIRDGRGNLIYWRDAGFGSRVVDEEAVTAINTMLADVVEHGTGRAARSGLSDRPLAGKTGTTQENRDAWFIGFSAQLIAGVWVGNDDASPMADVTGGTLPARIWNDFMLNAHIATQLPALPLAGLEPD